MGVAPPFVAVAVNVTGRPAQIVILPSVMLSITEGIGTESIINVLVEVAFKHGLLPEAVNVNVTLPLAISAALGV